jgi:hypothetical protein
VAAPTPEVAAPTPEVAAPTPEEADELPPVGVRLPFDVEELDVDGLALAEADAVAEADPLAVGLADLLGVGLGLRQLVPVALCVFLPAALLLAAAEAVEVVLLLALPAGLAVAVALEVALVLPLGLALLLTVLPLGPALVLVLPGLLAVAAGRALRVTDLLAVGVADGEELGRHPVCVGLGGPLDAVPWLPPPSDKPPGTELAALGTLLALLEVIPTAVLSWTNASCSGGTARATPRANTAHAIARAGRSSPSRQSRDERRARPWAGSSCPPRQTFQRRTRPARKPGIPGPAALVAPECLLA